MNKMYLPVHLPWLFPTVLSVFSSISCHSNKTTYKSAVQPAQAENARKVTWLPFMEQPLQLQRTVRIRYSSHLQEIGDLTRLVVQTLPLLCFKNIQKVGVFMDVLDWAMTRTSATFVVSLGATSNMSRHLDHVHGKIHRMHTWEKFGNANKPSNDRS